MSSQTRFDPRFYKLEPAFVQGDRPAALQVDIA